MRCFVLPTRHGERQEGLGLAAEDALARRLLPDADEDGRRRLGKFTSVPGKFWKGCPQADKEKRYKCTVVEFAALHDFGDGVKGAGFLLKEMGEDGRGSLEPGVASGEEFVMAYPQPFLEYYYYENRGELDPAVCAKLFPGDAVGGVDGAAAAAGDGATEDAAAGGVLATVKQEKPPIFDFMERRLICGDARPLPGL